MILLLSGIALLVVITIVALFLFDIIGGGKRIEELEKSIAVLPFHYYNMDPEAEDIGDAFSNEIITQLCKIRGFDRIISHTSTLRYKGPDIPPSIPVIGDELDANFIIEGSLERQDEDVSIQVQIVRAASDDHIWAEEFKGKWRDIFEIRAAIAKNVAYELKTILSADEIEQIEKKPADNLEAYDFYLLGNQYSQQDTEEDNLKAIEFYASAIKLDPEFALAYVGMGATYRRLFFYANWLPEEDYEKSREALLKALKINDQLAEAHASLAFIKYEYNWDFEAAERELIKAIEFNPNLAIAYAQYGDLLSLTGHGLDGHQNFKKALMLDPKSTRLKVYFGYSYYLAGQVDSAINHLHQIIQEYPDIESSYRFLGFIYLSTPEYQKAIPLLERVVEISSINPMALLSLGIAYARTGMTNKTRELLDLFDALENESTSVSFPRAGFLTGYELEGGLLFSIFKLSSLFRVLKFQYFEFFNSIIA